MGRQGTTFSMWASPATLNVFCGTLSSSGRCTLFSATRSQVRWRTVWSGPPRALDLILDLSPRPNPLFPSIPAPPLSPFRSLSSPLGLDAGTAGVCVLCGCGLGVYAHQWACSSRGWFLFGACGLNRSATCMMGCLACGGGCCWGCFEGHDLLYAAALFAVRLSLSCLGRSFSACRLYIPPPPSTPPLPPSEQRNQDDLRRVSVVTEPALVRHTAPARARDAWMVSDFESGLACFFGQYPPPRPFAHANMRPAGLVRKIDYIRDRLAALLKSNPADWCCCMALRWRATSN